LGAIRKIKRGKAKPSPLDPNLITAWNKGFEQGAKEQRESDIECLVSLLEGLEECPGIGEVTAAKIQQHFLNKFGK
jgi:hypothetical protein